jgi:hypothetical protein
LSPHPGQVKSEINSVARDAGADAAKALENKIHDLLFLDRIEEATDHVR